MQQTINKTNRSGSLKHHKNPWYLTPFWMWWQLKSESSNAVFFKWIEKKRNGTTWSISLVYFGENREENNLVPSISCSSNQTEINGNEIYAFCKNKQVKCISSFNSSQQDKWNKMKNDNSTHLFLSSFLYYFHFPSTSSPPNKQSIQRKLFHVAQKLNPNSHKELGQNWHGTRDTRSFY